MKTALSAWVVLLACFHANPAASAKAAGIGQKVADGSAQTSPDGKALARVETEQWFATPQGANSCLYVNAQAVYPADCGAGPKATYRHIHTFLSAPRCSPGGRRVAFVEKIFDWEYSDPFGAYFEGEASNVHYYVVIADVTSHTASGYALKAGWRGTTTRVGKQLANHSGWPEIRSRGASAGSDPVTASFHGVP